MRRSRGPGQHGTGRNNGQNQSGQGGIGPEPSRAGRQQRRCERGLKPRLCDPPGARSPAAQCRPAIGDAPHQAGGGSLCRTSRVRGVAVES
eukprot:1684290-Rhodomonas_salina.2